MWAYILNRLIWKKHKNLHDKQKTVTKRLFLKADQLNQLDFNKIQVMNITN